MVEQVLLEHPAPPLNGVHEGVLEGPDVQLQPAAEHTPVLHLVHAHIQRLKQVDLEHKGRFWGSLELHHPDYPSSCTLYLKDVKGQDIVRIMLCCRQDSEVVMRESYSLAYCS